MTDYPLDGPAFDAPSVDVPPPSPRSRRPRLLAASAAVVVVAGAVATYVAVSSSSNAAGGASTPQAAVAGMITDLQNSDVLGALDDLPPGERTAFAQPLADTVNQLTRLHVLSSGTDLHHLTGFGLRTSGLKYGPTLVINDHVSVVPLTAGKVTVSGNAAKLPLSQQFLDVVAPHGLPASAHSSQTTDLATEARSSAPVRIAAQQVDGRWYPSLFYTIADAAAQDAGVAAPAPAKAVPAVGGASADDAVRTLIMSLLRGDVQRAIEVVSPEELQVLHDYGPLIVQAAKYPAAPVTIKKLTFTDHASADGTRVALKQVEVEFQGLTLGVSIDGSCATIDMFGKTQRSCADQLGSRLSQFAAKAGVTLTPAERSAVQDLIGGTHAGGIATDEIAGRFYVAPVRTYTQAIAQLFANLKGNDVFALIDLGKSLTTVFASRFGELAGSASSGSGFSSFAGPGSVPSTCAPHVTRAGKIRC